MAIMILSRNWQSATTPWALRQNGNPSGDIHNSPRAYKRRREVKTDQRLWRSDACVENERSMGMHPCLHHSYPVAWTKMLCSISNSMVSIICAWVMNQNFVEFALPAPSNLSESLLTNKMTSLIRQCFLFDGHSLAVVEFIFIIYFPQEHATY